MATFVHTAIFLIRDYTIYHFITASEDLIARTILHKASIISHLSWLCLFLGFHTLGLYIHNDTVVAFGESEKQILIEAILPLAFCVR
jgi:photosystem I P700 chlorophyll a apoprotein A2